MSNTVDGEDATFWAEQYNAMVKTYMQLRELNAAKKVRIAELEAEIAKLKGESLD